MNNINAQYRLIGMVHCKALPGTKDYGGDMQAIINSALQDAITLEKSGFDALIVENMGDQPFGALLDNAQIAALSVIASRISDRVNLPIGINAAFNDAETALSIAHAIGAQFVRLPVFVEQAMYYGGVLEPCCKTAIKHRHMLGAESIALYADIQVKHTYAVVPIPIEISAKNAVGAGADALIVTGESIGTETPLETIERVKKVVSIPVIAGSGVTPTNINTQLKYADGVIVGSSLKKQMHDPLDEAKCKALVLAAYGKDDVA